MVFKRWAVMVFAMLLGTLVAGCSEINKKSEQFSTHPSSTGATDVKSAERRTALKDFPWPPPTPSDRMEISRKLIVGETDKPVSMLELSRRFTEALAEVGYTDHRFYAAPGDGFALITRMERIKADGTPEPEAMRFLPPDAEEPFSLGRFMKELFFAPEGYYRVIVFVVTSDNYTPSAPTMTEEVAEALMQDGALRLPAYYGGYFFTDAHFADALIYEFYKGPRDNDVSEVKPVRLPAKEHLGKMGFSEALAAQSGAGER